MKARDLHMLDSELVPVSEFWNYDFWSITQFSDSRIVTVLDGSRPTRAYLTTEQGPPRDFNGRAKPYVAFMGVVWRLVEQPKATSKQVGGRDWNDMFPGDGVVPDSVMMRAVLEVALEAIPRDRLIKPTVAPFSIGENPALRRAMG